MDQLPRQYKGTPEIRMTPLLRYILLSTFILGIFTLSFSCNLLTGPRRGDGVDTTSGNFTWQASTFGGASASSLYDVAIVSDTDIWAVGEVYLDSVSGSIDPFPYNAVHWNGQNWSVERIPYNYQGQPIYHPVMAVFALSTDDIWFGGNGLEHWDGHQFSNVDAVNAFWSGRLMQRIWASSDNNVYIVGGAGTAVRYTNGAWQEIESGTNLYFQDVYGSTSTTLAVASNPGESYDRKIIQINGASVTSLSDSGISWPLSSVWFVPGHYYVVGQGIYEKTSLSDPVWTKDSVDMTDYMFSIRANAWNDIFVAGSFLMHYNGKTWQSYQNETTLRQSGGYASVAIKNNLVVAVGSDGAKAVAVIGRR